MPVDNPEIVHVVLGAVAVHDNVLDDVTLDALGPTGTAVAVYDVGAVPVAGAFQETFAFRPVNLTVMSVG